MAVKTLSELFEHELKDIYYAEHRLVEALTELAGETKDREIKRAYTTHKKETQGQIKRLKQVFKLVGDVPEAEKCPGIEGLLKEKQNFTRKEKPSQEILDYYNLGAACKTERYEISAYEGLIEIAQQLGLDQAVGLLGENLQEEQMTLDKLKGFAQEYNTVPLLVQEEEEQGETSSKKGASGKGGSGSKGAASKSGASKSGASKSGAAKGGSSSGRGMAAGKGAAKGGAASKGGSGSKGGASKSAASTGGGSTTSRGSSKRAGITTKGIGPRNPAGPMNNDAGPMSADAGYRGEVEADSIMVAPDPVVTAGNR